MSRAGAHIRSEREIESALHAARRDWERLAQEGVAAAGGAALIKALCYRQLCLAQLAYLETILFYVNCGAGSRGSAMIVESVGNGLPVEAWKVEPENAEFREMVLESVFQDGEFCNQWVPRRPLPTEDSWFERVWADYREGLIFEIETSQRFHPLDKDDIINCNRSMF
jgi:hypothetical protein